MAPLPFLDTNVFLRHLRQDHPDFSPRATAYLSRIERGEFRVRTADTVILETVFTLQRAYRQSKVDIRDALELLIALPGIVLPGKRRYAKVFSYYVDDNISFADAYHAVLMEALHLQEIISFDREFDSIRTIRRVEP